MDNAAVELRWKWKHRGGNQFHHKQSSRELSFSRFESSSFPPCRCSLTVALLTSPAEDFRQKDSRCSLGASRL